MTTDDRKALDALDRFWDDVADGTRGGTAGLDTGDTAAIRWFQHLHEPSPPSGAADRVWRQIAAGEQPRPTPLGNARGHHLAPLPIEPPLEFLAPHRSALSSSSRVGWKRRLPKLATAALLAVTLVSMLVTYRATQPTNQIVPIGVPMYRGDAGHSGENPGPGPIAPPAVRWQLQLGGSVAEAVAVVDGTIYVNAGNALHAIVADNGTTRWRFEVDEARMIESPSVGDSAVFVLDSRGFLRALETATGAVRWQRNIGSVGVNVDTVPAMVVDKTVVVFDSGLSAFHTTTGELRWHRKLSCYGAPAFADRLVFVGCTDGKLHAIDAGTGTDRWSGEPLPLLTSPAIAGGVIYSTNYVHGITAVEAAGGKPIWHTTLGDSTAFSTAAVADGQVFVVSKHREVVALDAATGQEVWRFPLSGKTQRAPIVAGDVVYIGDDDGILYALDAATGAERWRFQAGGPIVTEPAILDGIVYLADSTNTLYALGNASARP